MQCHNYCDAVIYLCTYNKRIRMHLITWSDRQGLTKTLTNF